MRFLIGLMIALGILGLVRLDNRARAADGTPPASSASLTGSIGNAGWYTSTVAVNIASEDLESGVRSVTRSVEGGAPTTDNFTTGQNLAPNPSFESGSIDGWGVTGSAAFSQDPSQSKFDAASAQIVSSGSGLKAWQTASAIPLQGGRTYTFSVWTKYSGVSGTGVKLTLGSSASTPKTGTSDWVRIYATLTPSTDGSFTPQLGIDGAGTVNFDGAYLTESPFPVEVGFVISTSGNHTISFYGTNNDGVTEAAQQISFKIDSQGPSNWRNLVQTQAGNDHTYVFSIDADDSGSGLDTNSGQFQYSLDGGSTWGYYSNQLSCNSTWIQDGWLSSTQSPDNPGVATTTLKTNSVDFCDSDFGGCEKKARFRIKDVAGNFSARDFCLNSAWFQTQGEDVYSVGSISPSALSQADWWVGSAGVIGNLTSNANWVFPTYNLGWSLQGLYDQWRSYYYPGAATLPGGILPASGSGFYKVTSNYTVDGNTLPANIATADVTAVIFVDGTLSINADFSMKPTSAYIFIVSGNVALDGRVQNMSGVYLSQGSFDDHNGGPSNNPLTVNGATWALGGYNLDRDLGKSQNTSKPAEKFIYQPALFLNPSLQNLLAGEVQISWHEVDPDSEPCPP